MSTHRLSRARYIVAAALVLVLMLPSAVTAAVEHRREEPRDPTLQATAAAGDLTWQFAPRGIFADPRVVFAMAILFDEARVMSAAGLAGEPLVYGDGETRAALEEIPPGDWEPLLLASGVLPQPGGLADLEQARRCRVWTPATGDAQSEREAVVAAVGDELVTVLASIGVTIDPCETAASAEEADLAVSVIGLDSGLADLGVTSGDAFVSLTVDLPGLQPGAGTGGGDGPAPGQGGNAGVVSASDESVAVSLAMVALATIVLFGGRWATGARRR